MSTHSNLQHLDQPLEYVTPLLQDLRVELCAARAEVKSGAVTKKCTQETPICAFWKLPGHRIGSKCGVLTTKLQATLIGPEQSNKDPSRQPTANQGTALAQKLAINVNPENDLPTQVPVDRGELRGDLVV
jgi:hypothetical protein